MIESIIVMQRQLGQLRQATQLGRNHAREVIATEIQFLQCSIVFALSSFIRIRTGQPTQLGRNTPGQSIVPDGKLLQMRHERSNFRGQRARELVERQFNAAQSIRVGEQSQRRQARPQLAPLGRGRRLAHPRATAREGT